MKKKIKSIFIFICMLIVLTLPYFVFAENLPLDGLTNIQPHTGFNDAKSPFLFLGIVINAFLAILGIIFIVLMIYGGYNWMIAAGDETKVSKAKDTFKRAIIGLVLIVSSFFFWDFIYNRLLLK
jgi:hypothetical protein